MKKIKGIYYFPDTSLSVNASLLNDGNRIIVTDDTSSLFTFDKSESLIPSSIPGVRLEIQFKDRSLFIADCPNEQLDLERRFIHSLEKNKIFILIAIVFIPLTFWFLISYIMPSVAEKSVKFLPSYVPEQMGEQTFKILKTTVLKPSKINKDTKDKIYISWNNLIITLGLSNEKYRLYFFDSDYFGPNAFALPNGVIVITDDLIRLLDDDIETIEAILLHEIGHVEYLHSLKLAARSAVNSIVFSVVFADLEGVAEILIGTGGTLLENAFSRDMEREADNFALEKLSLLNKSPQAFTRAMKIFLALQGDVQNKKDDNSHNILQYLSTHPHTQERIDTAKQFNH